MSGLALSLPAAVRPPQEQNQHSSVTHQEGLKTRKTRKWISLPNSYASFPLKATKTRAHTLLQLLTDSHLSVPVESPGHQAPYCVPQHPRGRRWWRDAGSYGS